jgi:L-aspartate oxidase
VSGQTPGGTPPPPTPDGDGRIRTDVVIVGAGVAGLYAAACLPEHLDVVVVDKGVPGGESGSSPWAQGGLAVALGADDSPEAHAEDTLRAGDGLVDPLAAAVLAREAPEHVVRLLELGAAFDREPGHLSSPDPAHLHLAREGGQRVARSVHRADATGAEMVRVLREAAAPRVERFPGLVATLAQDATGRVTGVWALADGRLQAIEARAVLLATGGSGGLFAATTNPEHATGDGLSLAALAGAALRDVEFVQFHPTGLAVEGTWRFLLTEALRGAGATLHDTAGRRFLADVHPDAELAPRHVVSRAILEHAGGRAWLDATHLGELGLTREFPTVLGGARQHGFDLASERVPVTPAAHYHVGGVRTDLDARTSLPGLYACGEVASTGVHGANRMAGNSLSEALVFGARAARTVARELPDAPGSLGDPPRFGDGRTDLQELRSRLRTDLWERAGPARSGEGLRALAEELRSLRQQLGPPAPTVAAVELDHALRASALIVRGAVLRTESRGGHRRSDHPEARADWEGVHVEQVGVPGDRR